MNLVDNWGICSEQEKKEAVDGILRTTGIEETEGNRKMLRVKLRKLVGIEKIQSKVKVSKQIFS